MTERMAANVLRDAGLPDCLVDSLLRSGFVQVAPASSAGFGVEVVPRGAGTRPASPTRGPRWGTCWPEHRGGRRGRTPSQIPLMLTLDPRQVRRTSPFGAHQVRLATGHKCTGRSGTAAVAS